MFLAARASFPTKRHAPSFGKTWYVSHSLGLQRFLSSLRIDPPLAHPLLRVDFCSKTGAWLSRAWCYSWRLEAGAFHFKTHPRESEFQYSLGNLMSSQKVGGGIGSTLAITQW